MAVEAVLSQHNWSPSFWWALGPAGNDLTDAKGQEPSRRPTRVVTPLPAEMRQRSRAEG